MANPPSEPSPTQVNVASEDDKDIFLACLKEFKELGQKLDRIITSAERQRPDLTLASAGPVSDVHAPYSSPRNEDEQFEAFQRGMKNLSGAVQSIADGVKELKSAYRLVRVSEALRSRLTLVFYTLGAIAFPSSNAKLKTQWPSQPSQHWTPAQIIDEGVLPLDEAITSDAGTISERLQKLGQCVDVFNAALKGLPGFHDVPGYSASGIDTSLRNFAQDLKYWGRNLNNFQGKVHQHHIRAHVATIPGNIVHHLGEITDALGIFIRLGLPIVLHSERDPTFQNLSTVATLFASVSASTIQLSYTQRDTRVDQAVNVLWIVSLVFAIASAINSQLTYQWSSIVFMTPLSALPWWRSLWIRRAPLVFLVLSVISFSAGVVFFTFSHFSNHPIIPFCVTAASAVSAAGLFFVGTWFIAEYFSFGSGTKTGDEHDYLFHSAWDLASDWVLQVVRRAYRSAALWCSEHRGWFLILFGIAVLPITLVIISCLLLCFWFEIEVDEIWEQACDWFRRTKNRIQNWRQQRLTTRNSVLPTTSDTRFQRSVIETRGDKVGGNDAEAHAISQFEIGIRAIHQNLELSEGPSDPTTPIQKFRNVAMGVIKEKRHARAKLRKKMESMGPALKSLSPVQSSREHTTMIHDINFHYDGRYLVTFSREEDNILFWELDQMEVMVIDRVDMRRHGSSPAQELIGTWSRSRDHMRALRVTSLRENRVLIIGGLGWRLWRLRRLRKLGTIMHINWVPEISRLIPWVGLDYALEDAVLTPDGTKLLGIATLGSTADKNHLKPSRSPPECRIIICDSWEDKIDFEIPTFDPIRRMSLSYSGKRLLVMSDGSTPPRLFRVYPTWLVPLHTFDLPDADGKYPIYGQFGIRSPAPVAGESEEDQIIICANKRGEIFIWHRESYRLLYSFEISIPWGTEVSGVTFGCERLEDYSYLKVAAACTDGTVIMWGSKWDHPNPSVLTDELPRATSETTGGTIEEVIEGADGVVDEDIITEV